MWISSKSSDFRDPEESWNLRFCSKMMQKRASALRVPFVFQRCLTAIERRTPTMDKGCQLPITVVGRTPGAFLFPPSHIKQRLIYGCLSPKGLFVFLSLDAIPHEEQIIV